MEYEAVIGLEVHAEMATASKMFCGCPVVDSTQADPNTTVCPVCMGMPGVLPVVNQKAVEYGMRVALALECRILPVSIFARKNYFYPDLPKGYQISQFEDPLAENGRLVIETSKGQRTIRVRRAHLEEDAGKLTHITRDGESYSIVDLNRAGVPLLEIVSEPDMHTAEEAVAYATALRSIVQYTGINSGDMEKGVIRFEANISVRPVGSDVLGTRTEVKNLNSFRALERSIEYEIKRQSARLDQGKRIVQETLGWDDKKGATYSRRSKEEAHDYRYFPEPDLPPLVVSEVWVNEVKASLPELPAARAARFKQDFGLSAYDTDLLVLDKKVGDYFEAAVKAGEDLPVKSIANWILGELFGQMKQAGQRIEAVRITPEQITGLVRCIQKGEINQTTGKVVFEEMYRTGDSAGAIIQRKGLSMISDSSFISDLVKKALENHPKEVQSYLNGKENLANFFFGQVMAAARGQAAPNVVREELARQLEALKKG
jgi:aspartyl-tRNA(Asn)/glutamyl-tRNA(Gln) amidotransferase subunit B